MRKYQIILNLGIFLKITGGTLQKWQGHVRQEGLRDSSRLNESKDMWQPNAICDHGLDLGQEKWY